MARDWCISFVVSMHNHQFLHTIVQANNYRYCTIGGLHWLDLGRNQLL